MDWLAMRPAMEVAEMFAGASLPVDSRLADAIAIYKREGIWGGAEIRAAALDRWQTTLVRHGLLERRFEYQDVVIG